MTGSIVFATEQGLGVIAKEFYDNGIISKVLIQPHSRRENHYNWYPYAKVADKTNFDWLLKDIDSLLFFETPFDWSIIKMAQAKGIKTILMPMYECTQYPFPYYLDMILCPSLLEMKYYGGHENIQQVVVPVSQTWRPRKRARIFVHNAGNGGLGGRNGTRELLDSIQYVKSPIRLIVRFQEGDYKCTDPRVELRKGNFSREELYNEGDVFIFPEKFNGLSLPLQEAFASGMAVMAGNRFPINTWLPKDILIPVKEYTKEKIAVEFDSAVYDPKDIAKTIDAWYDKDITKLSNKGKEFNKKYNWKVLRNKYKKLCEK